MSQSEHVQSPLRRAATILAACVLAVAASGAVAQPASLTLEFEKAGVSDIVWVGTIAGDVSGVLTTVLVSTDSSASVWLIDFYWIVTADDPERSFLARLAGTLDSESGVVTMSGRVIDGYHEGATVEELGQMVDPDRSAFRGTIVIAPSQASSHRAGARGFTAAERATHDYIDLLDRLRAGTDDGFTAAERATHDYIDLLDRLRAGADGLTTDERATHDDIDLVDRQRAGAPFPF
jgi:hypothetical protein